MGFKLLLKMLGVITAVIVIVAVLAAITNTLGIVYVSLVIPIGLCAFIVYKFGKGGVVAILYFFGAAALLTGLLMIRASFDYALASLFVALPLLLIARVLSNKWRKSAGPQKDIS